jgi:hypothetical protein
MAGVPPDASHEAVNVIPRPFDDLQKGEVVMKQDSSDPAALVVRPRPRQKLFKCFRAEMLRG